MCEASEYLVQQEARVQVPTHAGPAGCYEVCTCGPSGRLENCVEMPCVDTSKHRSTGQRKSKSDPHEAHRLGGKSVLFSV